MEIRLVAFEVIKQTDRDADNFSTKVNIITLNKWIIIYKDIEMQYDYNDTILPSGSCAALAIPTISSPKGAGNVAARYPCL